MSKGFGSIYGDVNTTDWDGWKGVFYHYHA